MQAITQFGLYDKRKTGRDMGEGADYSERRSHHYVRSRYSSWPHREKIQYLEMVI